MTASGSLPAGLWSSSSRDPREPLRNLTVFNGFAHVNGNDQSKPDLTTVDDPRDGLSHPADRCGDDARGRREL